MKITPGVYTTILMTWITIFVLALFAWLAMRKPKFTAFFEMFLIYIKEQLSELGLTNPEKYMPLVCSLFLFISCSAVLTIIPGYIPPTSSLSATIALAICVFIAVPIFSISEKGFVGFLKNYIEPTAWMLPFNILSELTRTVALAVRLFGNMMSGAFVLSIIVSLVPLFFPIFFSFLGLIVGLVQAYTFTVLASIYIAAAAKTTTRGI
jgi:F-type H+-transporting ATPase subunit a